MSLELEQVRTKKCFSFFYHKRSCFVEKQNIEASSNDID